MLPLVIRRVSGNSMEPTLKRGSLVWALKWFNTLKVGNVVIFEHQGREKIKRLNKINENKLYLLSDNKDGSTDSRDFGYIDIDKVKAKVIWPRI
jgi:nickel-type superoxide dismutase maturation protease